MRIGFDASVASGQPGGTGTYAVQLLNALIPARPDWTFYLYFRTMDDPNPLLVAPTADNVRRICVEAPVNVWRLQVRLPRQLERDQIDVYHSPGYFLPLRWRGPKVVTIHDLNMYVHAKNWMRRRKFLAWLDLAVQTPASVWRARRIIVDSTATKQALCRVLRVRPENVRVIPLAPDPYFDQAAEPADVSAAGALTKRDPFILFVGILSPQKNLEGLIRAYAESRVAERNVRLVLAGADHEGYAGVLRKTAVRFRVASSIELAGYVPRSTLRGLYSQALCLVLPSHGEGFGLPMVEAMACGTPVLAANRQAIPEVLDSGGQLFEPDQLADLSGLLRRVAENGDFRADLRARALTRRKDFSWSRTAEATAQVYEEALRGR